MRVHVFQHVPFEDLGSIADWFKRNDATINYTRFFAQESLPDLQEIDFLIIMGGPMSVNEERIFPWLIPEKKLICAAIEANIPVLGICLGAQLIAHALGGRVFKNNLKEIGWFPVQGKSTSDLFFRFPDEFIPFHWHGETFDLPPGAVQLARSIACEQQAFQLKRNVIGLQFHLEMTFESVANLIQNCRNELTADTYVQTEQQLQTVPSTLYRAGNRLMDAVLNYLLLV
jgi:GMP synthase-like glutamine amidotransferase